ncbi:MAG: ATP-dependent Clp protease proteolytic subunit [Dysgonamonadaceae bacterium]|jgi:membrane-bound serine protease (ClpP class)|nr:ATP-dependent Clp protease proteolytic subunit [Dysgonamonadaceae bacterium]
MKKILFLALNFMLVSADLFAGSDIPVVYKIDLKREIDPTSRLYVSKGLHEAQKQKAEAILLHLNTYGGALVDADTIRTAILYSPIPVYVFIDNNAASAGALISIACKKIYMRRGANIGAATVVNQSGEVLPDKYQSYMRSTIRATAESHGKDTIVTGQDTVIKWKRDPRVAEAMVDDRISIPNVTDSGKILTLTAQEALKIGYCDGIAESVNEVITEYLGYTEYRLVQYKPAWNDSFKGFLMSPAIQAIFIMIIVAGIYFELQTPGFGFPSIAALTAAILYFAPLYMDGLVQNWELFAFIVGIILILLEIFVVPGFGITGISGIILVTLGLVLSLIDNNFFSFEGIASPELGQAALTVLSGLILGFLIVIWLSSRIGQKGLFRKVALHADLEDSISVDVYEKILIGKQGEALTVLRPSGKVMIDNGIYDAVSNTVYIEKGEPVVVVRFENAQLYVEKV